jgi:hypothetical protein
MIKILVNRTQPSALDIAKRQDFNNILSALPKKKIYTSPWFYGAMGFSSLAGLFYLIAAYS